ncbi:MAG: phosphodiesterase [Candidatus Latescibacteria bacterium]|nr:phosphodiesterase [Candidatus Latescibacterota bacterium]NIM21536.1 phosphodiesterase [Candidatus Latescibacterota bacterium]NIM65707.1 phosphodiesterase [Candidatus Latescibacterota bacterium]NIO02089.1 phosphodiesterase [Candidatus Latescibacterota bacterium]NIO28901.1 phosphodiesterase [Candidatus Latescibacterota bacterium]
MPDKLVIIGLDCVTPQLYYGPWLDEMPHTKRLIEGGIRSNLVSTIPPITVPAWTSMMTSQDPGMLGLYGFRNRTSYEYEALAVSNANQVRAKTVWNHLSRNRLKSIILGVPQTYPPKPLNGVLVSSFLTPDKTVTYTHPPELADTLDAVADGDYIIDVKDFRTNEKDRLLEQIYIMTERRFKVFRHLLGTIEWDFAMMVEMGPDRIHHGFWRFCDPSHRLFEPDSPYVDVLRKYYLYMDKEIGRTLDVLPSDASVIIVSDHGAKGTKGGICINEFLIQEGLLTLKSYPNEITRLSADMIDWKKTSVWGEGGYYARIFLNVRGREPEGVIPPDQYDTFRGELRAKLEALVDENGENIGTKAYYPEDIYNECKNIPPDLIAYLGDLNWRSAGTVGHRTIRIFENDTGPDDANHAQEGVFVWYNRGKEPKQPVDNVSIYDVAPSILDFYGIDIPEAMIGKVI